MPLETYMCQFSLIYRLICCFYRRLDFWQELDYTDIRSLSLTAISGQGTVVCVVRQGCNYLFLDASASATIIINYYYYYYRTYLTRKAKLAALGTSPLLIEVLERCDE